MSDAVSRVVVLMCRVDNTGKPAEIFDAEIEIAAPYDYEPSAVWRVEQEHGGWVCYERQDLWLPRKDGVFSRIVVYVHDRSLQVKTTDLLDFISDTFNAL